MKVDIIATNTAADALGAMGRTEDVTFSPDGKRLAIMCYEPAQILVFDVVVETSDEARKVRLGNPVRIASSQMRHPHGIAFLDDTSVAVANREGTMQIFTVPDADLSADASSAPQPLAPRDDFRGVSTPGSVVTARVADGQYDVWVCNNYSNYVSRHRVTTRPRLRVTRNRMLMRNGLTIPDGIAVSPSRRVIAVSNHNNTKVVLYANTWHLNRWTRPVGALTRAGHPHGIRFTDDGRHILVADAGAPYIHIYASADGEWRGDHDPKTSFRVMDVGEFLTGWELRGDGGPKGIAIDKGMNVLAVTSDRLGLVFYDLRAVLPAAKAA